MPALLLIVLVLQGPAVRTSAAAPQSFTNLLFCTPWAGCGWAWFYSEEVEVVASYGELDVWDGGNWGYAACDDCMRMIDEPGPHPEPVEGGGEEAPPAALLNYYEDYIRGTPQWCSEAPRYRKVRDYQVLDANGAYVQRVMFADESFTTGPNTCGVGFIEADAYTTSVGTFRDNFFMCGNVPACNNGGSCSAVRNQSWKADGYSVGSYTINYTCSGVTIQ